MAAWLHPDDRATVLLEDRVKRVFRELPGAVAGQEEPVHQVRVAGGASASRCRCSPARGAAGR